MNLSLPDMICHQTTWKDYNEVVCISPMGQVSFRLYYFHEKPEQIFLCNLYVTPGYRGKGTGSLVVKDIQKMIDSFKILSLYIWCKPELVSWYTNKGFYRCNALTKDAEPGDVWLKYKGGV